MAVTVETPVSSLRAIDVPLDMYAIWNRMIDDLEEIESDADMTETNSQQVLARLRPDAWAVSWGKRQVLLLELTRAHDWRQDWFTTTDELKKQRYRQLRVRMQEAMPSTPTTLWAYAYSSDPSYTTMRTVAMSRRTALS